MVKITTGWEIDPVTEKKKQKYAVIGYAETKKEGLQMLAEYHQNPFDAVVRQIKSSLNLQIKSA